MVVLVQNCNPSFPILKWSRTFGLYYIDLSPVCVSVSKQQIIFQSQCFFIFIFLCNSGLCCQSSVFSDTHCLMISFAFSSHSLMYTFSNYTNSRHNTFRERRLSSPTHVFLWYVFVFYSFISAAINLSPPLLNLSTSQRESENGLRLLNICICLKVCVYMNMAFLGLNNMKRKTKLTIMK